MDTRTRTGGPVAIQYEDFKPKSELNEEEEANLLFLYLPDFQKEQMKITYVNSSRLIRVVGERLISGNKWSRFNQAFLVPQNCDVQKIHGKFQNGVLTITMPKLTPSIPPNPSSTSPEGKQGNDKTVNQIPQQPKTYADAQKEFDAKKVEANDPKSQTQVEAISKVASTTDGTTKPKDEKGAKIGGEKDIGSREKKGYEKTSESKQQETKESLLADQSGENSKRRIEAKVTRPQEKSKSGKFGGSGGEKLKEDLFGEKVKNMETAAKKNVMELTEERQSLVNIGVAVLVIAALGSYIYYSHQSSGNSNN